jgi:peptide/nickel transport system ATP-binding protein
MCGDLMVMQDGEEVERLTAADLAASKVAADYTRNLLRASVGFSRSLP